MWIAGSDEDATRTLFRVVVAAVIFAFLAALPPLMGGADQVLLTDHFLWFFFLAAAACVLIVTGLTSKGRAGSMLRGPSVQCQLEAGSPPRS